jgi:hypothetical protein
MTIIEVLDGDARKHVYLDKTKHGLECGERGLTELALKKLCHFFFTHFTGAFPMKRSAHPSMQTNAIFMFYVHNKVIEGCDIKEYIKHEAMSVVDVFKEEMNFKTGDGPEDYLYMFKHDSVQYVFDGMIDEGASIYLLQ